MADENDAVDIDIKSDTAPPEIPAGAEKIKTKKKKKKKKGRGLKILTIILSIIIIIATVTVAYLQGLVGGESVFGQDFKNSKKYQKLYKKYNLYSDIDADSAFSDTNVINILMFGIDENEERLDDYEIFRPDTIILVSINLSTSEISMISIPRDSYVSIYGRNGKDKINACFYYGSLETDSDDSDVIFDCGVETLIGTVSDLLGGIPIDYYIGIDMDGVVGIIDYLGGVEVDVPEKVDTNYLYLEPGPQVMSGATFLTYARCREYSGGDIDRVSIQQMLLIDLFENIKQQPITKFPSLIGRVFKIVKTNITFKQALSLGMTLVNNFSSENISTETMPGMFGNYYGISYWVINQSERVDLIYEYFGITVREDSQDPTVKTYE
jgi:LCP family protein required for cell wall assembly